MDKIKPNGISLALQEDIPAILSLLNRAYRGEESRLGWTSEADLIAGNTRADEAMMREVMAKPGSVFLVYQNESQEISGCVNLQECDGHIYLGMFAVSPLLQGKGIGKKLLAAAEEYTKQIGCTAIVMSVIDARTELIAWYQRQGYADTGERKPFEEDGITGRHLQPLTFMMLAKKLY